MTTITITIPESVDADMLEHLQETYRSILKLLKNEENIIYKMSQEKSIVFKYPYEKDSKYHINETKKYNEHNKKTVHRGPEEEWYKRLTKEHKKCSKCKKYKLIMNYAFNCSGNCHFDKNGYRHTRPECKDCNKKEQMTCKLAMKKSKEKGEPVIPPLDTLCELCGTQNNIVYDHDHEICEFRGWLCDPCNRGLGQCGDNIDGLIKRLNYLLLKKNKENLPIINQDSHTRLLQVL